MATRIRCSEQAERYNDYLPVGSIANLPLGSAITRGGNVDHAGNKFGLNLVGYKMSS